MLWLPLGPDAFLLRGIDTDEAAAIADHIRALEISRVEDVVACYESVGVYGSEVEHQALIAALESYRWAPSAGNELEIPVCYELGLDTQWVCDELGITRGELAELHSGSVYRCSAIGFCPGFPYLGPLPDRLAGLGRLESPRMSVPSGSIGITGKQTGIYPSATPGGWRLIGRTPLSIVDLRSGFLPIQPGDRIRFTPITREAFDQMVGKRL